MTFFTPTSGRNRRQAGGLVAALLVLLSLASNTFADSRDQARRIHERIAGVPPEATVLDEMASYIANNQPMEAARIALDDPGFYDVTLKTMAAPWTNEAMTPFVPLNDYTATVVGLVRDEADFRTLLYGDILYVGKASLGLPAYSPSSNAHYQALEDSGESLKDALERVSQSTVSGLPSGATAGVITSRASARAFFSAGTNRAMFRFTLLNHLCNDLEQVADVTRPPDRIRQDVSRSPGGDSRVFLNNCVGCHSGMDPLAQAFAYYDYQYNPDTDPDGSLGRLIYNTASDTDPVTGSRVTAKHHINAGTFAPGYVIRDDQWDNYWREGRNQTLGWDQTLPGSGQGAKSMGRELAHSDAFAQCQVKKVFRNVCLREPGDSDDRAQIQSMVSSFRSSGFNLKQVFAQSAVYCRGD
jgi:hypothetical protein